MASNARPATTSVVAMSSGTTGSGTGFWAAVRGLGGPPGPDGPAGGGRPSGGRTGGAAGV
jgi:hypothetical protein